MTVHRRELLRRPLEGAAGVLRAGTSALDGPREVASPAPAASSVAPPPRLTVIAYGPFEMHEHEPERPDAPAAMRGRFPVLWVHADGTAPTDDLRALADAFGMHRLALEAATDGGSRARADRFGDALLVVAPMVGRGRGLEIEPFSLFAGRDFVVSFQARAGDPMEAVAARLRAGQGRIRHLGPDHLASALLDDAVARCRPVLDAYAGDLQALDGEIARGARRAALRRLHAVDRDLARLQQTVRPLRDALADLLRDPPPLLGDETRVLLRDVAAHAAQAADRVDAFRDLAASLAEMSRIEMGHRTNERLKALLVLAAIFLPLAVGGGAVGTGLVMPAVAWALGGATSVALLIGLRARGLLGRDG